LLFSGLLKLQDTGQEFGGLHLLDLPANSRSPCAALGQHRSTERKSRAAVMTRSVSRAILSSLIIELSQDRRAAAQAGWIINEKRVERIWRRASKGC